MRRDRIENWTAEEERKLLFAQLPQRWFRDILKEESKRKKGRFLVKLSNMPPGKPPLILQHELQILLQEDVEKVYSTTNGMVVVCAHSSLQKKALELEGWSREGRIIKASRIEEQLSGEDIFELIVERLQQEEKLTIIQQSIVKMNKVRERKASKGHQ